MCFFAHKQRSHLSTIFQKSFQGASPFLQVKFLLRGSLVLWAQKTAVSFS